MAKMITLSAYDCVEVDGYLYFFSLDYNFFFKMEISTGKITIVDSIPGESPIAKRLSTKIINYGDYLYFAPVNSNIIWRYSISSGEWKAHELKDIDGFEGKQAFYQAILHNEKIYFFGCRYPSIVVLDLKSEEIQYIEAPYTDKLKGISEKNDDVFFLKDYAAIDSCVYLASCLDNSVLKFDLDTYDHRYLYVGDADMKYSGIGYDGTYFYLTPRKKKDAVKWDGANGFGYIKLNYSNPGDALMNVGVLCNKDKITFYGNLSNKKFSVNEAQIINIDVQSDLWFYKKTSPDVYVSLSSGGNLTANKGDAEYKYLLRLDEDTIVDYISKKCKKSDGYPVFGKDSAENKLMIENNLISLKLFTKII